VRGHRAPPSRSFAAEFGTQPLHVIPKEPTEPLLVINLSRNFDDVHQDVPFSYSTVSDAVALSSPECRHSKLDQSNVLSLLPAASVGAATLHLPLEGQLYRFTRMRSA